MKLSKFKLYLLIWSTHIYIYYIIYILYIQYNTNVIHTTFYNVKSFLELLIVIPLTPFFIDYCIILIPLILMYYLVFFKRLRVMISYFIAITAFYAAYIVIYGIIYSFQRHMGWYHPLLLLSVAGTVNYVLFRKVAKRLDSKN